MATLLLSQIRRLRRFFQVKEEAPDTQRAQRSIEFAMNFDLIFSVVERMIYVDFHDDAKAFNKNLVLQVIVAVF